MDTKVIVFTTRAYIFIFDRLPHWLQTLMVVTKAQHIFIESLEVLNFDCETHLLEPNFKDIA